MAALPTTARLTRRACIASILLLYGCRAAKPHEHWYKGNLHAHTLRSDGTMLPQELIAWYVQHGYEFLGLSEHNTVADAHAWVTEQVARVQTRTLPACWLVGSCRAAPRIVDGTLQWRLDTTAELRHAFERNGRFILLQDEEVTNDTQQQRIHLTAVNVSNAITPLNSGEPTYVLDTISRRIDAQGTRLGTVSFGIVNHPNFVWAVTADRLARATSVQFVEVFNGHPAAASRGDAGKRSAVRIWDMANAERVLELKRPPLFGVGGDDTHALDGVAQASPGRGWIFVRAQRLQTEDLLHAMLKGDYYVSTGVTLSRCDFDTEENLLSVEVSPEVGVQYQIEFIVTKLGAKPNEHDADSDRWDAPDVARVVQRTTALRAQYRAASDDALVRATITATARPDNPILSSYSGDELQFKQAFTQPVGWQRVISPR